MAETATRGELAAAVVHRRREYFGRVVVRLASDLSLVGLLAIALIVFSVSNPDSFFTVANYRGIGVTQITVVFAAIGLLAPLIVGELDLSIGYIIGPPPAVVVRVISHQGVAVWLAIVITVAACVGVGLVNGLLVVGLGINSLITTLAVGSILYGAVPWYTG